MSDVLIHRNESIEALLVDPAILGHGVLPDSLPLAFIDLDAAGDEARQLVLPACPVIGLGASGHPLAAHLDTVVEAPACAENLASQVRAMPRAAAVTVQLLRSLPNLSAQSGLIAESMAYAMLQASHEHRSWLASRSGSRGRTGSEGKVVMVREDRRLIVTLDRPDCGNAIDRAMRDGLYEALSLACLDPEIEEVALRANGKAFSLGAELSEFGTTTDPATAHAIRRATLPANKAALCADRLSVHVQGACVGAGLELAAWASGFTASSNAWFQLPELAMGILPGAGGCVSLTRRIGRQRTALLILSGKRLSARRALEWGLIDTIVDDPA